VLAHHVNETFACVAKRDGVVEFINPKMGLVKIAYDTIVPQVTRSTVVSMSDDELKYRLSRKQPVYLVRYGTDLNLYKVGDIIKIRSSYFSVADTAQIDTIDRLPKNHGLTQADLARIQADMKKLPEQKMTVIKLFEYVSTEVSYDIFKFGVSFASVSGSHVQQNIMLNVVEGERIKRGDVIAYNSGFFEPDPLSKQVTWKHGVQTTVAILETDSTLEDSCSISEHLSQELVMQPAHQRTITINANTVIHQIVSVGDHIQTTDLLAIIEDADIDALTLTDDPETVELLNELNRKGPRAKFHGTVADIDILYSCNVEDLHPSIAALVKVLDARKNQYAKIMEGSSREYLYPRAAKVPVGTKYRGVLFDKDTVLILIMIQEEINLYAGDKLVFANQLKSTCAGLMEKQAYTESGVPVHALFGARSIKARIVNSAYVQGIGNRLFEWAEKGAVKLYFGK